MEEILDDSFESRNLEVPRMQKRTLGHINATVCSGQCNLLAQQYG